MIQMLRPTVAVFAKPNGLSIRLVETLLSGFCFVKILSEEKDLWGRNLSHIPQKSLFKIVSAKKEKEAATFEYLVLLNEELSFAESQVLEVCRWGAAQSAKILIVLPFVTESPKNWQQREGLRAAILKKVPEAALLYAGDIYGPFPLEETGGCFSQIIKKVLVGEPTEDYGETSFYPIFYQELARYLSRSVFSFGPYGKEIVIYSEEISGRAFLGVLMRLAQRELPTKKKTLDRKEALGVKREIVGADLEKNLRAMLANRPYARLTGAKPKTRLDFIKRGAGIGFFILATLPFLLMTAGAASLFSSLKNPGGFRVSTFTTKNAGVFFQVYSRIPLLGLIYRPFVPTAKALALTSEVGTAGVRVFEKGKALVESILGDEVYDPAPIAGALSVELGDIYTKTGLLQGEIQSLKGFPGKLISSIVSEGQIEEIRKKTLYGKALVEELPELLGKKDPKTYLVLFQNNMELRPTGGFIGSFALASFDGGRLVDISAFDVYAADGQLKGHIEPPAAIRKYLGEANWFLRDSNWDPDFPTSAARAEWFLDKEIDKQADGVVGIDLEVAKGILRATGPVVLTDFNQVFDYKNLDEVLQEEVEAEFFPGSQKKANMMTGLTKEIIKRLSALPPDKYSPVAKELFAALTERHLQVYLNEKGPQEAISGLGFSGEVARPACSGNCFSDWYAAIDANVGVTKANYFINRSFDLEITVSGEAARKQLAITYENTANPAIGQAGRYKTFTRILAPETSVFEKVKIENAGIFVETELEDGGVAVEVSPGQTKKLIFIWENPIQKEQAGRAEYRFYVRKQAGTLNDPITVDILTPDGSASYNSNLARDFFARIFFE